MSTGQTVNLKGRRLWIPRMTHVGARMMAAVFRSQGIESRVVPPCDQQTLELGGLYTSGEECYPEKITMGDFLKIVHADDFDPSKHAFFMPTAEGPCRFGQYAPYLRQVLDEMGHRDVPIVSPTSKNGYDGLGGHTNALMRNMWRAMVASDILRKLLLKTRPYEKNVGDSDRVYNETMELVEKVIEQQGKSPRQYLADVVTSVTQARDLFRAIPADFTKDKPLITVVGEIFCRLSTFSNYDAVRKIEAQGGEVWLSDVTEWIWYTNWSQKSLLVRDRRKWSLEMLGAVLKTGVQRSDEHKLLAPLAEDFVGYEEPHRIYDDVLKPAWPYLPADGALGEMVLSVGKGIYTYGKGADGIIDISPFSCMNGIVSEAVYHSVAADHDDIPIRNFYFDSSSSNMERDLDIFMELARSYQKRKTRHRQYPAWFK